MKNILFYILLSFSMGVNAQNTIAKTVNGKIQGAVNADNLVKK